MKAVAEKTAPEESKEIAAQTMLGDLMKICVDMAKALPKSWAQLSENEQDTWLNSIEKQCREAVKSVVQIIASEGNTRIPVTITSTAVKKNVVVNAELVDKNQVVEMLQADTRTAILVLANSDHFLRDEGKPVATGDQRSLNLGNEYKDK